MTVTTVKLKQVVLGSGRPKIAVPITGKDRSTILEQANKIVAARPDLIEWRLDYYQDILNFENYRETALQLNKLLGDIPLLTTFRTQKEGGGMPLSADNYVAIYQQIINHQLTDALDIELFLPQRIVGDLITAAHDSNIAIIMSNHDFQQTPAKTEIISRLTQMAQLNADVAKIAVMPQSAADVSTLLAATEAAHRQLTIPLITMAMGNLGKISRISGEVFGSALTFGTVGAASAPGQIELKMLRHNLAELALD
ncbi:type I 3-dehydroquinate dehydratase [Loigolactobacillus iwatensis]|uniref:type I 3-dehydroquinate dehydratase n=1 Tax=Loigolactobacillus iwatensis TaxID=1267156 RepID=UPI000F7E769C|nr:type I 3-dehydroquinate dehydratase [Loigolactobacillus iwatensis]